MATLSKHGNHALVEGFKFRRAYCEDGVVLETRGNGWRVYGKLKDKDTWYESACSANDRIRNSRHDGTPQQRYMLEMEKAYKSLKVRNIVHTAINLMPRDPDGVVSEVNAWTKRNTITMQAAIYLCELAMKTIVR